MTGSFGTKTKGALLSYQKDRKIVKAETQKGAGVYGPATKNVLVNDIVDVAWKRVRAQGITAL
jgi:hypothetical protein